MSGTPSAPSESAADGRGEGQAQGDEAHEALLVDRERLTRVATRIERLGRGPRGERERRPIGVQRRRAGAAITSR